MPRSLLRTPFAEQLEELLSNPVGELHPSFRHSVNLLRDRDVCAGVAGPGVALEYDRKWIRFSDRRNVLAVVSGATVGIPSEAGQGFRREGGHRPGVKAVTGRPAGPGRRRGGHWSDPGSARRMASLAMGTSERAWTLAAGQVAASTALDAQRHPRDADTAVANAEDAARHALLREDSDANDRLQGRVFRLAK